MVGRELSAEGARQIGEDFVLHDAALGKALCLPATLGQLANREKRAIMALDMHPAHKFGEIPYLVGGVPYWQLELAFGRSWRKRKFDLEQVLGRILQRDEVVYWSSRAGLGPVGG